MEPFVVESLTLSPMTEQWYTVLLSWQYMAAKGKASDSHDSPHYKIYKDGQDGTRCLQLSMVGHVALQWTQDIEVPELNRDRTPSG